LLVKDDQKAKGDNKNKKFIRKGASKTLAQRSAVKTNAK